MVALSNIEIYMVQREIDLFVKLFKDFYPEGGFLNSEQIEKFKEKINVKCGLAESYR